MNLTAADIQEAYNYWQTEYAGDPIDQRLIPFLDPKLQSLPPEARNWICQIRESQGLTQNEVARRLGISRTSFQELEQNEKTGALSLRNLEKIAQVLDCELIYAIRPRQRISFSELLWQKVLPHALSRLAKRRFDTRCRGFLLGRLACELMQDPKFRRQAQIRKDRKDLSLEQKAQLLGGTDKTAGKPKRELNSGSNCKDTDRKATPPGAHWIVDP